MYLQGDSRRHLGKRVLLQSQLMARLLFDP